MLMAATSDSAWRKTPPRCGTPRLIDELDGVDALAVQPRTHRQHLRRTELHAELAALAALLFNDDLGHAIRLLRASPSPSPARSARAHPRAAACRAAAAGRRFPGRWSPPAGRAPPPRCPAGGRGRSPHLPGPGTSRRCAAACP